MEGWRLSVAVVTMFRTHQMLRYIRNLYIGLLRFQHDARPIIG